MYRYLFYDNKTKKFICGVSVDVYTKPQALDEKCI